MKRKDEKIYSNLPSGLLVGNCNAIVEVSMDCTNMETSNEITEFKLHETKTGKKKCNWFFILRYSPCILYNSVHCTLYSHIGEIL